MPAALPERHAQAEPKLWLDFTGVTPRAANVTRILPESDARTGNVTVQLDLRAEVLASGALRPGTLGRVGLPVGAIERIGQVERAWLVREGHALAVNVRTAPASAGMLEVLAGLAEGDQVLVR